jgi:hypothetical protein
MKNNEICLKKSVVYMLSLCLLLLIVIVTMVFIGNNKSSTNARADFNQTCEKCICNKDGTIFYHSSYDFNYYKNPNCLGKKLADASTLYTVCPSESTCGSIDQVTPVSDETTVVSTLEQDQSTISECLRCTPYTKTIF